MPPNWEALMAQYCDVLAESNAPEIDVLPFRQPKYMHALALAADGCHAVARRRSLSTAFFLAPASATVDAARNDAQVRIYSTNLIFIRMGVLFLLISLLCVCVHVCATV